MWWKDTNLLAAVKIKMPSLVGHQLG